MRLLATLVMLAPLLVGGCISLSDNTPPKSTTVVVPQSSGTTVVCANGRAPPC